MDINDWFKKQNNLMKFIETAITPSDLFKQHDAIIQSIESTIISSDWLNQHQAIINSIESVINPFDFQKIYSQLNTSNILEITEIISEYTEANTPKENFFIKEEAVNYQISPQKLYTEEELKEFVDSRIAENQKNQSFFKKLVEEVKLNYGLEAVKWLVSHLFIPFIFFIQGFLIDNHEVIISIIQESIQSGIYVVGYSQARKFIKNNGLSKYENINYIGILRTDSLLRSSYSKNSSLILSNPVKINTIVNIIERKSKWIKIEVKIKDSLISGWVEKSKVIKFKRQR